MSRFLFMCRRVDLYKRAEKTRTRDGERRFAYPPASRDAEMRIIKIHISTWKIKLDTIRQKKKVKFTSHSHASSVNSPFEEKFGFSVCRSSAFRFAIE